LESPLSAATVWGFFFGAFISGPPCETSGTGQRTTAPAAGD
jgi:hypothetical protein